MQKALTELAIAKYVSDLSLVPSALEGLYADDTKLEFRNRPMIDPRIADSSPVDNDSSTVYQIERSPFIKQVARNSSLCSDEELTKFVLRRVYQLSLSKSKIPKQIPSPFELVRTILPPLSSPNLIRNQTQSSPSLPLLLSPPLQDPTNDESPSSSHLAEEDREIRVGRLRTKLRRVRILLLSPRCALSLYFSRRELIR